jgi:hypothetical protein
VSAGSASEDARQAVVRLEQSWMEAVRDRDLTFLEQLLAPEFTLTTGRRGAEVRSREEWLRITRDRYIVERFEFEWIEVDVYPGAAVARSRYRQRGRMWEADRSQPFLITDVFVERGGRWRAVTRHITPLPAYA